MMKSFRIIFVSILILIINISWAQTVAKWHTSMGDFEILMREDLVPITVSNFVDLTNANFYDNLIFHRVIDDFMIQDGCPDGNGYGGPGYTIPDEFHEDILFNSEGVIGMANTGQPNSAGSQYFITLEPTTWLNWSYAAFGNVIAGMDVVQEIGDVPTTGSNGNPPDKPLEDVNIDSIRIVTPQITNVYPEEDTLYVNAGDNTSFFVMSDDENLSYSWFVNEELQPETSLGFNYTYVGGETEISCIISNGEYEYPVYWQIEISGTNADQIILNQENFLYQNTPNPFNPSTTIRYQIGSYDKDARIEIYNLKGQKIEALECINRVHANTYEVVWNGTDQFNKPVASGIYMYKLIVDDNIKDTKKMIILK